VVIILVIITNIRTMTYTFEPIWLRIDKKAYPKCDFNFNVSSHSPCTNSFGLYILIQVAIIHRFTICIKPFGEIKLKS